VPNSPLISVRDLSKNFSSAQRREGLWGGIVDLFRREYRTVEAVSKISFEIEPGEMVGYIGPNGAGKSTTIKMLTGILVPSSGEMVSNGCPGASAPLTCAPSAWSSASARSFGGTSR
jgi:ABC-2 type transport system ATP-binding protein